MSKLSKQVLVQKIQQLVAEVVTNSSDLEFYGTDRTRQYSPAPLAIVFPRRNEEVLAVVEFANQYGLALVPSGGRTGLSGGAVAPNGEIVVSLERMNKILAFSEHDRQVVCQAGVVTQQLQEYALEKGLFYPVDFASSGSSQIGGNIATNAGGIKVIRYGMTRQWVAGLKVVTGEGKLLDLNKGLVKNATGYDLRHLFVGAEGTLGIIVEATLSLTRLPKNHHVLLLGVPNFSAVMSVLKLYGQEIDLTAFEFFSDNALNYVEQHTAVRRPFANPAPNYVLIEFESDDDKTVELAMSLFEQAVEDGLVVDGVISQNQTQAENLWKLREYISESIAPYFPYKNDISVQVSKVSELIADVEAIVKQHYPDFEIVWFGHVGDGNMHLNILKPQSLELEEFIDRCKQVSEWVYETVGNYGGSISAEHGVGLLKKQGLKYSRSEEEISYMKAMKSIFDPNGIMNPGKVFD